MNDFTDPRFAACDKHLSDLLFRAMHRGIEGTPPASSARAARIVSLFEPDERYSCHCGVPAHWYVRLFETAAERTERGAGVVGFLVSVFCALMVAGFAVLLLGAWFGALLEELAR